MTEISDEALLALFQADPERAWPLFLDRHAEGILIRLRRLGFGHDEAMDRFVYVCEKLCADHCRRLRSVQHAGERGDLTPWLDQVVTRLAISWTWSEEGRRRLLRPIARLAPRDRRVFELHFWHGLAAGEIYGTLRAEGDAEVTVLDVLDGLERVFSRLSQKKRWRLLSNLARRRPALSLDSPAEDGGGWEIPAVEPSAEQRLLAHECNVALERAVRGLAEREQLALRLRFEEELETADIARILGLRPRPTRALLRRPLDALRRGLTAELSVAEKRESG